MIFVVLIIAGIIWAIIVSRGQDMKVWFNNIYYCILPAFAYVIASLFVINQAITIMVSAYVLADAGGLTDELVSAFDIYSLYVVVCAVGVLLLVYAVYDYCSGKLIRRAK